MFSIDTGIVNNYRPTQDLNGREVLASAALSELENHTHKIQNV